MKLIYIAGPYRSNTEWGLEGNIRIAEEAALELWQLGAAVICPHKNTANFGGAKGLDDNTWLKGDIEIMKRCDAVFALIGWHVSRGATEEIKLAKQLGIPVFEQMINHEELQEFLKT
jgi:hypothetical protein